MYNMVEIGKSEGCTQGSFWMFKIKKIKPHYAAQLLNILSYHRISIAVARLVLFSYLIVFNVGEFITPEN
jgi:hypothetical protein